MRGKSFFIKNDRTVIKGKVKEAFTSVLPIAIIVFLLSFTVAPVDSGMLLTFVVGVFLSVLGIGFFSLGADTAMTPIGEFVGMSTVKTKKLWVIIPVFFFVGVMITVSEPDLQVLATQLKDSIPPYLLIVSVGVGVGLFLVLAFLRIILKIKLSYLLVGFYAVIFIIAFVLVPKGFIPLAFDSGGVTTGPMSVPFIIAIGTGVANIRGDKDASNDSFGLTALCSVGPIISVMILGVLFGGDNFAPVESEIVSAENSVELISLLGKSIPEYLKEVAIALLPIVVLYYIFVLIFRHNSRDALKILVGIGYTYFGLVLFLTGVNFGFLPMGNFLGKIIGGKPYNFIAVPIGAVIGFFVVAAEPAVHVLVKQVYEITEGAIPKKALLLSLMIGVAVSVALAMLKILLHIDIMWILVPGYAISLVLAFIVPDIFTAIAFDSGGVASGAMTAGFLLPLALGLCSAVGGNVATDGFGVVALVAMTPLIAIQVLGLVYKIKVNKLKNKKEKEKQEELIIE